jgi:DNA-binding GntR family transcriptional regulator
MNETMPTRPGRASTGQGVVDFLGEAILGGRFAPGQRLVEADLTRELGVSRGPVREAFRRLAADGLVEVVPNRGALVRQLSVTEARELFELRTELEAFAARRAAERLRDPDVRERFRDGIAEIWDDAPRRSTADYIAENQRFHAALVEAAGNGQLEALHRQLALSLIMAQIAAALTPETMAASLAEHRQIATAVLEGDAARADRALRDHLGRATGFLHSVPAELFRADDGDVSPEAQSG